MDGDEKGDHNYRYEGPSPDEICLVDIAASLGYKFLKTTNEGKNVQIWEKVEKIKVLQQFEFNSKRKRSSIIIEHEGTIKMLIKGADSAILERLSPKQNP